MFMNVSFCHLEPAAKYFKDQFVQSLHSQQKKISVVALGLFSLIVCSILAYHYYCLRSKDVKGTFTPKQNEHTNLQNEKSLQGIFNPREEDIKLKTKWNMCHSISSTASIAISQCPKLVIGKYDLFQWDEIKQQIKLSHPFQSLLQMLFELGILETTDISSLDDLNTLLQKPQGQGGLLRKPGSERWEMSDHHLWQKKGADLEFLLAQLGFMQPQNLSSHPLLVKHCLIFGARVERMETRIQETLQFISSGDVKPEKIFLLGSKRKLIPEERVFLEGKLAAFGDEQKAYWQGVLTGAEDATEANAFVLLWESLLSDDELKKNLEDKVIFMHSSRLGFSYREREGHRTTTDVTTDDWTAYYQDGEPQTIFALVEQPYGRLLDQLRASVLTNGKQAALDLVLQRIANTTFYFVQSQPKQTPLMSVVCDEIARHVYRTVDVLRYLEQIQ
jgi:hypothetical protein